MTRCQHVFTKGGRKGDVCNTNARSGASHCSRHNSASVTVDAPDFAAVASKHPTGAIDAAQTVEAFTALECPQNSQQRAGKESGFTAPIQSSAVEARHHQTETKVLSLPTENDDDCVVADRLNAGCDTSSKGCPKNSHIPTTIANCIGPRSSCTPESHVRKYNSSVSKTMHITNAHVKSNESCDIFKFMGILESCFEKHAQLI